MRAGPAFKDGQMYKDRPVYLDHDVDNPQSRSVRDLAATIESVAIKNGKPYGVLRTANTEAGRTLLELVKFAPAECGLSHSAMCTPSRNDENIIESVDEVISVDAVMSPATVGNFSENTQSQKGTEAMDIGQFIFDERGVPSSKTDSDLSQYISG